MQEHEYPPQEPLTSEAARGYRDLCVQRSARLDFEELSYGADPYQAAAIYRAKQPRGPVLIFAHGGGWTSGYKEWMGFMAPPLNAAGITFVSLGYRLAPRHLYPAGLQDVARGILATVARCQDWGARPDEVFIGGHSAGAHYAALLAADPSLLPGSPRGLLKGCLPISGVYQFGSDSGLSIRPRFLGADETYERSASPLLNIVGVPLPFLISYGERDFPHLIAQAKKMSTALAAAGGAVTELELPGCDHFAASLCAGAPDGPWVAKAISWMNGIVSSCRTT